MSEKISERPVIPFMPDYPEWNNLVSNRMHASVEASVDAQNDPYVELRRTLATLYSLNNLYSHTEEGDEECTPADLAYDRIIYGSLEEAYEAFVAGQPDDVRLPYEDYDFVCDRVARALHTPKQYKCMQYTLLFSDSFKNPELMLAFGLNPENDDHDAALLRLFTTEYDALSRQYFPSFYDSEKFDDEDRTLIRTWTALMAFNLPGWAQSQSSTSQLKLFPESLGQDLRMQFLIHGMLDIMGVRGAESQTSALAYTKPTHDMLMAAHQALTLSAEELGFPAGTELSPADREHVYLTKRADYFGVTQEYYDQTIRPYQLPAEMLDNPLSDYIMAEVKANIGVQELRAQIRLANVCRYRTHEQFAALRDAYNGLRYEDLEPITDILGSQRGRYVLDYGPAYLRQLLQGDHESLKRGLLALSKMLYEIRIAHGDISHDAMRDQSAVVYTSPDIAVLLGPLALVAKNPDFTTEGLAVTVERDGGVLTPSLVTIHEKLDNDYNKALERHRRSLEEYWESRGGVPDEVRDRDFF